MMYGKIVRFDENRGFGFIAPETGGSDVFIHVSEVLGEEVRRLRPGTRVSYEQADSGRGPKGLKVRLVQGERQAAAAEVQQGLALDDGEADLLTTSDFKREARALMDRYTENLVEELAALANGHGWVEPDV